jgi:predicted metal-dependent hydrolase
MEKRIDLGGIAVHVVQKDIKNIHLSVYPPVGEVRISAPLRMDLDTVRVFAISKLSWIKQQRKKILGQERETDREYLNRESHYVWGKRYLLKVVEKDAAPTVHLRHNQILLQVRPEANTAKREAVLEDWYRGQVRAAAQPTIAKWEPFLGVQVQRLFVQRMKTKWGSCSPHSGSIRLNTELGKKPRECLEYIILEPTHNERFIALLNRSLPHWRYHREALNRLPLRHENWRY